ncbi:MAG: TrkH family potassium uptake protein [Bacteroidales bacterium]|nr:TrkH family potassium uptake protein [Bacteroidales bacterium]
MINWRVILHILGILLFGEAFFILLSACISFLYSENNEGINILLSSAVTAVSGAILYLLSNKPQYQIGKREGYIIVSFAWIIFSIFGCLPFLFTESIPSFTNAFFETASGFTTTGASILNDIESLPHGVLFWRSLTQWLGGMGIIVLSIAILPILGIGGMELFVAEVPGLTPDKLHPRITDTAKRLWIIYIIYTLAETILLMFGGMNLFDAVNHSFTTMATGGYSTKQDSIAYFNSPYIDYIITLFMFLAGTNFTLSYFALKLNFKKIFTNEEFRYYTGFILIFSILIALGIYLSNNYSFGEAFRISIFQVVSIITTTGYITSDYLQWIPVLTILIFALMFFGGSAGSTGGGIKIVRIVLMLKTSYLELKRLLHPNAVIPVKFNNKSIPPQIISVVMAFIAFYVFTMVLSTIIMASLGLDFESAIGSSATCLGNIGPGIGSVGPVFNFNHVPIAGKWFLSFLMILGRLELFTMLVMFTPAFWKR